YSLFGELWPAVFVGILFGVHPLTVEPIPWTGERKTLLAAFFGLWSLVLYLKYVKTPRWSWFAAVAIAYVLALLSKPTSTPLPAAMLLMDIWPLRRLGRRAVLEKIPLIVIGAVFAVITVVSQARTAAVTMPTEYGAGRIPLALCHNAVF